MLQIALTKEFFFPCSSLANAAPDKETAFSRCSGLEEGGTKWLLSHFQHEIRDTFVLPNCGGADEIAATSFTMEKCKNYYGGVKWKIGQFSRPASLIGFAREKVPSKSVLIRRERKSFGERKREKVFVLGYHRCTYVRYVQWRSWNALKMDSPWSYHFDRFQMDHHLIMDDAKKGNIYKSDTLSVNIWNYCRKPACITNERLFLTESLNAFQTPGDQIITVHCGRQKNRVEFWLWERMN